MVARKRLTVMLYVRVHCLRFFFTIRATTRLLTDSADAFP